MEIQITVNCNFTPQEEVDIQVNTKPEEILLTQKELLILRGAFQIALDKLPVR